jgi:hypothetical protein
MEYRFNELSGKQLRKPKIECFVDRKRLDGGVLVLDSKHTKKFIELKNIGDGSTDQVKIRLYLNYEDEDLILNLQNTNWQKSDFNDRPEYAAMFVYDYAFSISPQASVPIDIWIQNPEFRKNKVETSALLKIFYGEPIPYEVTFSFEIQNK